MWRFCVCRGEVGEMDSAEYRGPIFDMLIYLIKLD